MRLVSSWLLLLAFGVALVAAECPLKPKCPYVADHHASSHKKDCPLKTGNCPYYSNHRTDVFPADYLTEKDGKCPLDGSKCTFYQTVKDGKPMPDLSTSNCPLKDKCPYLKSHKSNAATESGTKCPMKGKCPYADAHADDHPRDGSGCPLKDGGCPYYSKHKGDVDMDVNEGCPLKEKCPYYADVKAGKKVDYKTADCPLAEKCPYYKEARVHAEDGGCPVKKDFNKDAEAKGGSKPW
ncbi:hypothetical protein BC830DRAFT_1172250 [Chytriomyces sp. MP71]|nr:hypothetical protein BC830DRAFT_1172250 [Chytriomyces sp. MP71]